MYDLLIKNGEVIDGSGSSSKKIDLAIKNGKIIALDYFKNEKAKKEINAEGRLVVPGFIDINTTADHDLTLFYHHGNNLILQGVTTIIGGNSGVSLAPLIKPNLSCLNRFNKITININWRTLKEFLEFLTTKKIFLNFGTFIGWGILRSALINNEFRSLNKEELAQLLLIVKQSMEEGALGVSFGLGYDLEQAVGISEIKAVAEIVQKYHGNLSFYLRNYSNQLISALEEVLSINNYYPSLSLEIELLRAEGEENKQLFDQALDLINEINKKNKNTPINFSFVPYNTNLISLYNLLPDWALVGGREVVLQYLANQGTKQYLIQEVKKRKIDYSNLIIISSGKNWWFNNKTLKEIAQNFALSLEETILKLITITNEPVYVITKLQSQDKINNGILSPYSFITSNSGLYDLDNSQYRIWFHPKTFGTFPKFIYDYIIQNKLLTWEDGIRKITGRVADWLKIKYQGYIKENYFADLVIINPLKLKDKATEENPFQYSEGIEFVILRGNIIYERGIFNHEPMGRTIVKQKK